MISNFERSNVLRRKAHALIPGGCHTYAKGDDQYPELAPGFVVRGLHRAEPLQDLHEPVCSGTVDACGLVHKFT